MTGKIQKRRTRILEAVKTEPKPFKRIAKELNLSNSLVKKDMIEMEASGEVIERNGCYVCTK
tara:strand:+ start:146 stop:331 length:186 start_codon:yes stop_codon:yes gene_type:complete